MKAEEILDSVNRSFLPIRIPTDENEVLDAESHVREFLNCFNASDDHPFDLVAPIFYQIHDWRKDKLASRKRIGAIRWFGRVTDMNDRLDAQLSWSELRDPASRRGVTSRVMDAVNTSTNLTRVLLIIQPEGCELPLQVFEDWRNRMSLVFTVSRETMQSNVQKAGIAANLLGASPTGIVGVYEAMSKSYGEAKRSNFASFQVYPEYWWLLNDGTLRELAQELEGFVDDHSVYIDPSHTLLYVFSNIVNIGVEQQKGCGGLFLSVRNDALANMDDWMPLAERLADKVANRVVHQMQLDEVHKSAMRSGISRLAGRGAAHNLGSNALQRLTRPGVLRSAIGLDKAIVGSTPYDHSEELNSLVAAALAQLGVPRPDLENAKRTLENASEVLRTKRMLNAKAEDHLRTTLGYMKDRMELLAQIATMRSGLLESRDLGSLIKEFGDASLLIDHMVTGGFTVKFRMPGASLAVGITEGPNGVSALFNLFENVLRNANRHTTWNGGIFTVEASHSAVHKDLVEVKLSHEWEPRDTPAKALEHIRSALTKPMLDPGTGAIRRGGWGMLEQKLVCAFLRELDLSQVDDPELSPALLGVDQIEPVNGAQRRLVYTFHLPRPRDVVRITKTAGSSFKCIDGKGDEVAAERVPKFPIAVLPKDTALPAEIKLPMRSVEMEAPSATTEGEAWKAYCEAKLSEKGLSVQVAISDNEALVLGAQISVGDPKAKKQICCIACDHETSNDDLASYEALVSGCGMLALVQPIGTRSSFGHLTTSIQQDIQSGGTWAYRLAEAAITPIVVLDERIQEALESEPTPSKGMTLKDRLRSMGVFVPDRGKDEIDLNNPVVGQLIDFLNAVKALDVVACMPARHVIIHRTVLQKLYPDASKGTTALKALGFCPLWTSGAAGGDDIGRLDMDYVPFSMLERNTIVAPCKWQLVDMVMGAGIMNTERT